jgi:putative chitinase
MITNHTEGNVPLQKTYLISKAQLLAIMPRIPKVKVDTYFEALNEAMVSGQINTKPRICMYLANIAHESCELRHLREEWGPTKQQLRYERDFNFAWPPTKTDKTNRLAYTLGNSEAGDGKLFSGAGPIQVTGRGNITKASTVLFGDDRLTKQTELLNDPLVGFKLSIWYWNTNHISDLADKGDFIGVVKAINGGTNGLEARQMYFDRAMKTLV